jgi:hypothetical protein
MAERPGHNPSACAAISQSKRAICEKLGRTSSTAIMIAMKITAEAPSCFSKVSQGHREFSLGKIVRSLTTLGYSSSRSTELQSILRGLQ